MTLRLVQVNVKARDDAACRAPQDAWCDARRRGPGRRPWTVLADPEGNEFCVLAPA
ncbi:VOC family protein [Micromonospora costi]